MSTLLRPREAAAIVGITAEALRQRAARGLLASVRTEAGQLRYPADAVASQPPPWGRGKPPCGTNNGFQWHYRRHQHCPACYAAHNRYTSLRRVIRRVALEFPAWHVWLSDRGRAYAVGPNLAARTDAAQVTVCAAAVSGIRSAIAAEVARQSHAVLSPFERQAA